jgi:hypothetical protein
MIETAAVTQFSLPHMSTPGRVSLLYSPLHCAAEKYSHPRRRKHGEPRDCHRICWISTFFARFNDIN